MTVREALRLGTEALAAVPDPKLDAELLLCRVTGLERLNLLLAAAQTLTDEQEQTYRALLADRAARKPLQYILGTQAFYGRELAVNETVLIPRQETETLCEQALLFLETREHPTVADLCTGSGAIAITLKTQRRGAQVWATDLSRDALNTAQANAARNGAEITFMQGDLLAPLAGLTFDLIACNPPYIPTDVLETLQPEVRREPRMALDGGVDGLVFYRRLAQEAPAYLKDGGRVYLELGDGQAEDVSALFAAEQFEDIRTYKDLYGNQRVLQGRVHHGNKEQRNV